MRVRYTEGRESRLCLFLSLSLSLSLSRRVSRSCFVSVETAQSRTPKHSKVYQATTDHLHLLLADHWLLHKLERHAEVLAKFGLLGKGNSYLPINGSTLQLTVQRTLHRLLFIPWNLPSCVLLSQRHNAMRSCTLKFAHISPVLCLLPSLSVSLSLALSLLILSMSASLFLSLSPSLSPWLRLCLLSLSAELVVVVVVLLLLVAVGVILEPMLAYRSRALMLSGAYVGAS